MYTTDSRFSLHNLPLKLKGVFQFAAGDFKKKRSHDDSLVIVRKNTELSGNEVFIPSQLLHGVVLSALLEAFHIWQGEDELLRGTPIEEGSQWFNFKLEISLSKRDPLIKGEENVVATIVRRPFHIPATKIKSQSSEVSQSALLQESGMRIQPDTEDKEKMVFKSSVMELTTLGYLPAACRLALRKNENIMEMAASWLLDENNLPNIMGDEVEKAQVESFRQGCGVNHR